MAKMIEYQDQIIAKLMAMNNKPKGFFQKFLEGVKKVLEIAIFVLIGRGIGGIWVNTLRPGQIDLEDRIRTLSTPGRSKGYISILSAG